MYMTIWISMDNHTASGKVSTSYVNLHGYSILASTFEAWKYYYNNKIDVPS